MLVCFCVPLQLCLYCKLCHGHTNMHDEGLPDGIYSKYYPLLGNFFGHTVQRFHCPCEHPPCMQLLLAMGIIRLHTSIGMPYVHMFVRSLLAKQGCKCGLSSYMCSQLRSQCRDISQTAGTFAWLAIRGWCIVCQCLHSCWVEAPRPLLQHMALGWHDEQEHLLEETREQVIPKVNQPCSWQPIVAEAGLPPPPTCTHTQISSCHCTLGPELHPFTATPCHHSFILVSMAQ